jgi:hypothetical protein
LTGIVIAIPIVMSGRADVLALRRRCSSAGFVGLAAVGALAVWLYRVGVNGRERPAGGTGGMSRLAVVWQHVRARENLPYLVAFRESSTCRGVRRSSRCASA